MMWGLISTALSQTSLLKSKLVCTNAYLTFPLVYLIDMHIMSQTKLLTLLPKSVPPSTVFQIFVKSDPILPVAQVNKTVESFLSPLSSTLYICHQQSCQLYLQNISRIWKLLTTSTANFLIQATIISCLDYYNSPWLVF